MHGLVIRSASRAFLPAAIALVALALPVLSVPAAARGPEAVADVAEKVIDSVVHISTSQKVDTLVSRLPQLPNNPQLDELFKDFLDRNGSGDDRRPQRVNSLGSGFIIDASGLILTNNHVIEDADEIHVTLSDGTRLEAKVKAVDIKTDLALLEVKPTEPLKPVKFGDSDKLRLGEWVIAIGSPFSLGGTVTAGIVSARNRNINSGPYDNYIQTDAAINRGNSGGPLFNLDGEVVGVNTAIISPSGGSIGIGFAVPSKTALAVANQLREFGEVRRGWLGVQVQTVTDDIADSLNIKPPRGALVSGLIDGGPAKAADIQPGDVIIRFDGQEVKEMRELPKIVSETPVGKTVDVVVLRDGKEVTTQVTLGRLEDGEQQAALKTETPPEAEPVVKRALGLTLSDLSGSLRDKFKLKDDVKGVVITGVEPASVAEEKHLSPGDVILEVAMQAVGSAAEFEQRIEQIKREGRNSVLLFVAGISGDRRFVALPLE